MCSNEVTQKDLHDLLEIFEKKSYEAGPCEEHTITKKCEYLFKLDYSLIELDNTNGILSPRYPGRIFIPEYEHGHMASTMTASNTNSGGGCNGTANNLLSSMPLSSATTLSNGFLNSNNSDSCDSIHAFVTFANPLQQQLQQQLQQAQTAAQMQFQFQNQPTQQQQQMPQQQQQSTQQQRTIYEDLYDIGKIRELITMAKYARCRQRFAVPVIMYRGKYICRSATISVMPETYGRKVVDYAYDCLNGTNYAERANTDDENNDPSDDSLMNQINEPSPFSYDEVIKSDIQLLTALNVTTIVDLMVEKRKIKYFMAVSSSEKADDHYENFNILSLPYPGCEFFKKFRDNNYMAKNLYYNWKQSFNDATISIPKLGPAADLDICWYDYKTWDLVLITQNYLKATLKYIQEENSGLLIHCISGWDRTPLFISLVRLSLWADGLIHQSLNALQMAYFTLSYDWYLFGHQLPDRLKRGEDILFFCFHVLKYISDEEFSVIEQRKRTKTSSSSGSSSVIVLKADCCDEEAPKEEYILNFDQDSNESFSNLSNCDNMSMTDNYYPNTANPTMPATVAVAMPATVAAAAATTNATTNNTLTSRSPNPKRSKTSPITVPGASATRQRQESTSSNGSWQVVTETGSIDSTMNGSYIITPFESQPDNSVQSGSGIPISKGYTTQSMSSGSSSNASGGNGPSNSNVSNTTREAKNTAAATDSATATEAGTRTPSTLRKQRLNAVRAIFIQGYGKTVGLKFKEAMNLGTFIGSLADQLF